jgi:formylglycine-generating enzyme required for sulfatase activity
VINATEGEAPPVDFALPFQEAELRGFHWLPERVTRDLTPPSTVHKEASPLSPQSFGTRLFDTVFAGDLGAVFLLSYRAARSRQAGLRLRLRLSEAPDLAGLPWEYLYATNLGRFLALSDQTPVVRYLEVIQPQAPLEVSPPLRILAVVSDPSNVPALNVKEEWARLRDALAGLEDKGLIDLEVLEEANLDALQDRLRERRRGVHVLHFIGHGHFDALAERGELVFEGRDGRARRVPAEDLASLLHNHDSLRLVFLNACEGAKGGLAEPYTGVAQKLVQQGIPAVVAMQVEITDNAALDLAHMFYKALADGYPVDAALTEARIRVKVSGNEHEWGTPVLFSRAPDNLLFALPELDPIQPHKEYEPKTVPMPRGTFLMGSNPGSGVPAHETPQHEVYLPGYHIGKYPVTNRQYYEYIRQADRAPRAELGWPGMKPAQDQMERPVAGVTWYDAVAYCQWLSRETGRQYGLPSEAQWEKAARGPDGLRFPWGGDWEDGEHCNTDPNRVTQKDAYPGGQSPYGCYDMVGNVGEWTTTLWGVKSLRPDEEYRYPWPADGREDGRNDREANERIRRIYRGGAREYAQVPLRASLRGEQIPTHARFPGVRLGFRVVLKEV